MKKFRIGIDTGGTFTDGVLFDKESERVVASVKEETTHYQLSVGAGKVLQRLIEENGLQPNHIEQVNLSSTLATNSVVEKKGARVGLIVIGYVKHFRLPVTAVVFVKGGHNIKGEEEEPLELEYLVDIVQGLKDEVDAFGVCSAMSIHNPAHELVAEKAISMITGKPVFCSHQISQQAGMEQRAATAGLHAKLMPVMADFVQGMARAMEEQNLSCPMYIISGNGKLVDKDFAVEHAGVTVASGPYCTARFGAYCAAGNGLVVDVGGTTTDITMLQDNKPVIAAEGCVIGDWKTHVEAVDMFTGAIGGDSLVTVTEGLEIEVGPRRVFPLVKAGAALPEITTWLGKASRGKIITLTEGSAQYQNEVVDALQQHGSLTPHQLKVHTKLSGIPLEKRLEDLSRRQCIGEIGFTPTDALHVLGRLDFGNTDQAIKAAAVYGELMQLTGEEFCQRVVELTEKKIEDLIIDYIAQKYWGKSLTAFISARNDHPVLGVDFSLKLPIIGIGAAARVLLPEVAKRLGTSVEFPPHCEVGNAAGAALISNAAS